MDPLHTGILASFCSNILGMQKKMLKQSGISKTSAAEAADNVSLSSEAAEAQEAMGAGTSAPQTPQERFLADAVGQLSKLNPQSDAFFYDSVSALVDSALREAFGGRLELSRGYPQMKDKIVRTIMEDERYQDIVGDFLESWSKAEEFKAAHLESESGETSDNEADSTELDV
ncbi:MAG: hypothetical protein ACI38Q_05085 [Candidatus Bruticola sp.]